MARTVRLLFQGRSGWGGGRENGGLTYSPEPKCCLADGQLPDAEEHYVFTLHAGLRVPNFWAALNAAPKEGERQVILHRDNWTGAILSAKRSQIEIPIEIFAELVRAECERFYENIQFIGEFERNAKKWAELARLGHFVGEYELAAECKTRKELLRTNAAVYYFHGFADRQNCYELFNRLGSDTKPDGIGGSDYERWLTQVWAEAATSAGHEGAPSVW
jgi:hypothetical protein